MIPEVDLIDTLLFSNSDGLDAANYKVTAYSVFGMCHKKAFLTLKLSYSECGTYFGNLVLYQ